MSTATEKPRRFPGFLKRARFTPSKFTKIYPFQKGNIETVTIVSPRLGSRDFGSIEVSFRVPVNNPELCQAK
jgi:hypothetical protein